MFQELYRISSLQRRRVLIVLFLMTIFRLAISATFPLSNDESYYWDWGQDLHLSYLDHPPGVAWLTWASSFFFDGLLGVRVLSPFFHLLATLFILCTALIVTTKKNQAVIWTLVLTQGVPGLSLWGVFTLPDTGLLLALSVLIYLSVKFHRCGSLSSTQGIVLGLALGLAGVFKYHALPVGGGIALGLLLIRGKRWKEEISFWVSAIIAGFLCTLPVWIWNIQNGFASFAFQGNHGFADLEFNHLYFLRALLGQMIFLTPVFFATTLVLVFRTLKNMPAQINMPTLAAVFGFIPLFFLIEGVAPFKQTLPHWIVPAFWIMIPFSVECFNFSKKTHQINFLIGALITFVVPLILSISPIKKSVLESSDGDPGPLWELTLWEPLNKKLELEILPELNKFSSYNCQTGPIVIGFRWFWVSQLHFQQTTKLRTTSLDPNHFSYYNFRDIDLNITGCPVAIVGKSQSFQSQHLEKMIPSYKITSIEIPGHEKLKISVAYGVAGYNFLPKIPRKVF